MLRSMRAIATLMTGIVALAFAGSPARAYEPDTLDIGAQAPPFNLPGVDGQMHALEDYAEAKVLVVIFTCNHCPTAQAYEDRIKRIVEDYKDKGVAVVAISPNDDQAVRLDELGYTDLSDSLEEMKVRARDHEFNFPYLYDGRTQEVSKAYGAVVTPHVFIFDEQRKLQYVGRIDDSEDPRKITSHDARNAIDALLAGEQPPVRETKVFGCSVKWSDKRASAAQALERWNRETAEVEMIGPEGVRDLVRNDSQKLRLINVWATWCGPCVAEFPDLIEMHRMYRHRDFELVTISADKPDRKDRVLSFLNEQHASGRNFLFSDEDVYKLVDAVDPDWQGAIPYTLVVKPGGEVIYRHMGAVDPLEVKRAIVGHLSRYYFKLEE